MKIEIKINIYFWGPNLINNLTLMLLYYLCPALANY